MRIRVEMPWGFCMLKLAFPEVFGAFKLRDVRNARKANAYTEVNSNVIRRGMTEHEFYV